MVYFLLVLPASGLKAARNGCVRGVVVVTLYFVSELTYVYRFSSATALLFHLWLSGSELGFIECVPTQGRFLGDEFSAVNYFS